MERKPVNGGAKSARDVEQTTRMFVVEPEDGAESIVVIPRRNASEGHMGTHLQFGGTIVARRQEHRSAARRGCIYGGLNRLRVVALAVTFCAKLAWVDEGIGRRLGLCGTQSRPRRQPGSSECHGPGELTAGARLPCVFRHSG